VSRHAESICRRTRTPGCCPLVWPVFEQAPYGSMLPFSGLEKQKLWLHQQVMSIRTYENGRGLLRREFLRGSPIFGSALSLPTDEQKTPSARVLSVFSCASPATRQTVCDDCWLSRRPAVGISVSKRNTGRVPVQETARLGFESAGFAFVTELELLRGRFPVPAQNRVGRRRFQRSLEISGLSRYDQ